MNAPILEDRQLPDPLAAPVFRIEDALVEVERLMKSLALRGDVDLTATMASAQLSTGGKRVRARLALAAARDFGVSAAHAIAWGACVELLHNATLVHDDIQDGDRTRRGRPSGWAEFGVAQAINAGDFLLMLPFLALSELPPSLTGRLSVLVADYATRIVRGQVDEMAQTMNGTTTIQQYLQAVEGKTGALLALPVVGAAVLAGRAPHDAERLGAPFVQLGVMFQLQDDVIDMFGEKGRGTIGGDVYEGKNSALLVTLCAHSRAAGSEACEIVQRSREETSLSDIQRVRMLYQEHRIVSLVLKRILQIREQVLSSTLLIQEKSLHYLAEMLAKMALAPLAHLLEEEVQ